MLKITKNNSNKLCLKPCCNVKMINFYYRQYHHHDMALIIDGTFKYVDTNPLDGLLEKEELSRAFENLDANGKPFRLIKSDLI